MCLTAERMLVTPTRRERKVGLMQENEGEVDCFDEEDIWLLKNLNVTNNKANQWTRCVDDSEPTSEEKQLGLSVQNCYYKHNSAF